MAREFLNGTLQVWSLSTHVIETRDCRSQSRSLPGLELLQLTLGVTLLEELRIARAHCVVASLESIFTYDNFAVPRVRLESDANLRPLYDSAEHPDVLHVVLVASEELRFDLVAPAEHSPQLF